MELRKFGKTKRQVTPFGLGLAALGRPGYINLGHGRDLAGQTSPEALRERTFEVLDAAWELGVRYFDTARSYGAGEAFLGAWLRARRIRPEEVTIGSKWGYTYTADWQIDAETHEVKEHTLPVLRRQIGETAENLAPYLDIYHIHSATLDSGVLDRPEVLDELARLKERRGWIAGLSLSGPGQPATLERALEIRRDGVHLFGSVQATWNVLEPSCGPLLQAAHAAGWGVIVKEAVANGRLTPRSAAPPEELVQLADELQATIDAVALAAVLAQPWVTIVLSGAATVAQLQSNLTAQALPPTPPLATLHERLAEPADEYWGRRAGLDWN